jgi:hypothetical protein
MSNTPRNWRLDRDMKLRNDAVSMLETLDHMAISFGIPHEKILDEYSRILKHISKARASIKDYIQGYFDKMYKDWFNHELVFCHVSPDGKYYTNHKEVPSWAEPVGPLYEANLGCEIARWKHAHFWKNGKRFVEPVFSPNV